MKLLQMTAIFFLSALVAATGLAQSIGTGSGSGAGSGTGDAVGAGDGTTGDGGGAGSTSGDTEDDSGIFAPNNDASTGEFPAGDAAPRTEPEIRDDRFNTAPRVPGEPGLPEDDAGGAGSTGGEEGTEGQTPGTIDENGGVNDGPVSDDAGVAAPRVIDDTMGDRELTRQRNGTDGSRPDGTTIR